MKTLLLAAMAAMALAGCTNPLAPSYKAVEWSIAGDGSLHTNCDTSSKFDAAGYHSFDAIWLCAQYNGDKGVYVSLTFESTNDAAAWHLVSTYASGGVCR